MRKSDVRGYEWWCEAWSVHAHKPNVLVHKILGLTLSFKPDSIEVRFGECRHGEYHYPHSLCACDFCPYIGRGVQPYSDGWCRSNKTYRHECKKRGLKEYPSALLCQRCSNRLDKHVQEDAAFSENRKLINQIVRTIQNGKDSNHRATQAVSC